MGHVNREQRWGKTICQYARASITPSPLIAVRGVPLNSWMIVYKRAPPEFYPAEDPGWLLIAGSCRLINGWMLFHIQKNWRAEWFCCFALKVLQGPPVQQAHTALYSMSCLRLLFKGGDLAPNYPYRLHQWLYNQFLSAGDMDGGEKKNFYSF